jgi:hypothetical protein
MLRLCKELKIILKKTEKIKAKNVIFMGILVNFIKKVKKSEKKCCNFFYGMIHFY